MKNNMQTFFTVFTPPTTHSSPLHSSCFTPQFPIPSPQHSLVLIIPILSPHDSFLLIPHSITTSFLTPPSLPFLGFADHTSPSTHTSPASRGSRSRTSSKSQWQTPPTPRRSSKAPTTSLTRWHGRGALAHHMHHAGG